MATKCKIEDVNNTPLERDDLYDVKRDLNPLAAKWKEIGIALRLRGGELDKMDTRNPDRCLSDVLESWLKRNYDTERFGLPTWRWLVEIVADPAAGNDTALADNIATKHVAETKDAVHEVVSNSSGLGDMNLSTTPLPLKKEPSSSWCCCFRSSSTENPVRAKYASPTPRTKFSGQADISTLVREPWYHGDIPWQVAKERLNKQKSDCFLVRKSQSQPGKYVISVKYAGEVKHHTVREENQHYEVEGTKKQFHSMSVLVSHYKTHCLSPEGAKLLSFCSSRLEPPPTGPSRTMMDDNSTKTLLRSQGSSPPTPPELHIPPIQETHEDDNSFAVFPPSPIVQFNRVYHSPV